MSIASGGGSQKTAVTSQTPANQENMSKRARSMQKNNNNNSKFLDSDSSLLMEAKRAQGHDKSFTEHIDDKNRVQYSTHEPHNISSSEIMKKRHNSTERGSKISRPRSSKGYRGGISAQSQSTSQIPKIPQNKSEERILKSQGNSRAGPSSVMQVQSKYMKNSGGGGAQGDQHHSKVGFNQNVHFNSHLHGDGSSGLSSNFALHSKSQKPIEFKKIQNLQVKAGGQVQVNNSMQSSQPNLQSQKQLIKINYDDLKKVLTRDGNIGLQSANQLPLSSVNLQPKRGNSSSG